MQPKLYDLLKNTPGLHGGFFDPLSLIRSVNALQPLGKERALDTITDFLGTYPGYGDKGFMGMFWVLRCLFEVPKPPGFMPHMSVGAANPPDPADPFLVRRFPLTIVGDIPIDLVEGYVAAGPPPDPLEHVVYFRRNGTLRAKPLRPTNRPLDVMASLQSSRQWFWERPYPTKYSQIDFFRTPTWIIRSRGRAMIRMQLVRLLSSVYPASLSQSAPQKLWDLKHGDLEWKKIVRYISRLKLRWDTTLQDYVSDGINKS